MPLDTHHCPHCPHRTRDRCGEPQWRRVLVHGTREQALERLPRHCALERLELATCRVSLVCEARRVDALIIGEIEYQQSRRTHSMVMLELHFDGRSAAEADRFTERYRARLREAHTH